MPQGSKLPDPNEPLTEWEKALLEKFFSDPNQLPAKFKAWLTDYVSTNGSLHISNMPSLKGEEWREVGASGQPAFENSWTHFDTRTVRFMKDVTGWVHLEGIMKNGTVGAVAFTLPAGYRPRSASDGNTIIQPAIQNAAAGYVIVKESGGVQANNSNVYVDLSSIHFRAA